MKIKRINYLKKTKKKKIKKKKTKNILDYTVSSD